MSVRLTVRGVVFSALFAALLVVLSLITVNIGISPVPFTMENLAVMLAGAILGPWYGFFSMLLVVVLTALGLPLLHNTGGIGDIIGPSGGFVWFWPVCAFATGWFVERVPKLKRLPNTAALVLRFVMILLIIEVFGSLLNYVAGVPQLAAVAGVPLAKAMVLGCYPFLFPDFLKAVVAALITLPVSMLYPPTRLVLGNRANVVRLDDDDQPTSR